MLSTDGLEPPAMFRKTFQLLTEQSGKISPLALTTIKIMNHTFGRHWNLLNLITI